MDTGEHTSKENQKAKGKGQKSKVFPVRGLRCSIWILRMPRRSCEQSAVPVQVTLCRLTSSDWAAHDLAYGPCSTTSSTERVFSIAWRKRNQEAGGMRCAVSGG